MKMNKTILWSLLALVVVAALYRLIPDRPLGFAPQFAMALFAGVTIRDRKWALALPVLSMFLSDLLYQALYQQGWSSIPGFYEGQWQNYILFALMAALGFFVKRINVLSILTASLAIPTVYFLLSNFILWAGWTGTRGLGRPRTWEGLLLCYNDALPFYRGSLEATVVFSAILFGGYWWLKKGAAQGGLVKA